MVPLQPFRRKPYSPYIALDKMHIQNFFSFLEKCMLWVFIRSASLWTHKIRFRIEIKKNNKKTMYSRVVISTLFISKYRLSRSENLGPFFHHGNLTTGDKMLWRRREIAPLKEPFVLFFLNIFNISLLSGVKLHIHLWHVVVWFIFSCRDTDISKSFRESFGLPDNNSWLYF